ncbi:MAG: hypothetical protein NTX50_17070 [Candidatus Sumerlaeota bacterium]|nr:hypothetical protein [Candidatus Sumerlaeota bacterium]
MGLLEEIERTAFLGEEFLTWLWFRSETSPRLTLPKIGDVKIEVGEPIAMRGSEDQDASQITIKGERAGASAEAHAALREGKKLYKCRVVIKQGELGWPCALSADSLGIASLTLPVPKGMPANEALILRGQKLEEFTQIYFALYEAYLDLRLNAKKWHKTEETIRKWVLGEA